MVTQSAEWQATITVNWGGLVRHEVAEFCTRHSVDKSRLFTAVATELMLGSKNTIGKFERCPDVPLKAKDRSNAVALLMVLGVDLERFGLSLADRQGLLAEVTPQRFSKAVRLKIVSTASDVLTSRISHAA